MSGNEAWVMLERYLFGELRDIEPYGTITVETDSAGGVYLQLIHSRRGMIGIEVNQPIKRSAPRLPADVVARLEVLGFEADHEPTFECFRHVVLPWDWDGRGPSDRSIPTQTAALVAFNVTAVLREGLRVTDVDGLRIDRANTGQPLDNYWFEIDDEEA